MCKVLGGSWGSWGVGDGLGVPAELAVNCFVVIPLPYFEVGEGEL